MWSAVGGVLSAGGRLFVGVSVGAATAVAQLAFLGWAALVALLELLRGRRPEGIERPARHLVEVERWRIAAFLPGGAEVEHLDDYPSRRAVAYLGVRWLVGLLGGFVALLFLYGLGTGAIWARDLFVGRSSTLLVVAQVVGGLVLFFLAVQGFLGVAALDRWLARRLLVPSDRARYERRISELAASRAGVVAAVDAERRRIERDLHDGVQQRLVALGLLLGQARRGTDRSRSDELVRQAHDEAREILAELRDVAWRAYPADLDHLGLAEALARVAERGRVPVTVDCRVGRLPSAVETAAYFVVSEAVTNAAKHAPGSRVSVCVVPVDGGVRVTVTDDGPGGADAGGGGLSGLARRAAALDGSLLVDSPAGGPTTVTAELPCA
ncbi:histidine kinase [Asanoa sp. WMMD1127]|uniref:sensor histidine kinase n=1 Tax=Asanoa sp. WMMD1127 TaxID=3016107 RepID=UPI0024160B7F|nr:histidine kinase [Asanoa sp. WMMD1127]MDG4822246.1 histidine kinase [Asanoa sp. WMMD1127]